MMTASVRLGVMATPEYSAWLNRMSEHLDMSTSRIFERAMKRFAAEVGFEPPPRRSLPQGRSPKTAALNSPS